ncbi:hypothetical protein V6N12_055854 [Hibiscus sabdariffa]|uniref:Uncharacterized protein n=1 Tax=Hibiscus sabdariffa TaxID=183260 RepID=A0ABR2CR98_9ROSI
MVMRRHFENYRQVLLVKNLEGRQIKVQGFCSSENSSSKISPFAVENSASAEKTGVNNLGSREIINSDIPEEAKVIKDTTAGEKPISQLGEKITTRKNNEMSWAEIVAKHSIIPEQVNEGPLFPNIRECSDQDRILTEAAKTKRDCAARRIIKKLKETDKPEIQDNSLTSSYLKSRRDIILGEARKTINFERRVEFEVKGDFKEAVRDMARLAENHA